MNYIVSLVQLRLLCVLFIVIPVWKLLGKDARWLMQEQIFKIKQIWQIMVKNQKWNK